MSKINMLDGVMSYFDKYQFSGSHTYKEPETTVSRKMLHVPEVVEDDKDLEF